MSNVFVQTPSNNKKIIVERETKLYTNMLSIINHIVRKFQDIIFTDHISYHMINSKFNFNNTITQILISTTITSSDPKCINNTNQSQNIYNVIMDIIEKDIEQIIDVESEDESHEKESSCIMTLSISSFEDDNYETLLFELPYDDLIYSVLSCIFAMYVMFPILNDDKFSYLTAAISTITKRILIHNNYMCNVLLSIAFTLPDMHSLFVDYVSNKESCKPRHIMNVINNDNTSELEPLIYVLPRLMNYINNVDVIIDRNDKRTIQIFIWCEYYNAFVIIKINQDYDNNMSVVTQLYPNHQMYMTNNIQLCGNHAGITSFGILCAIKKNLSITSDKDYLIHMVLETLLQNKHNLEIAYKRELGIMCKTNFECHSKELSIHIEPSSIAQYYMIMYGLYVADNKFQKTIFDIDLSTKEIYYVKTISTPCVMRPLITSLKSKYRSLYTFSYQLLIPENGEGIYIRDLTTLSKHENLVRKPNSSFMNSFSINEKDYLNEDIDIGNDNGDNIFYDQIGYHKCLGRQNVCQSELW